MPQQLVLADDLSGPARQQPRSFCAQRASVCTWPTTGPGLPPALSVVLAIDLDSRRADPAHAASSRPAPWPTTPARRPSSRSTRCCAATSTPW